MQASGGPAAPWWPLLPLVAPLASGGPSYLWWPLLPLVAPLTSGGPSHLSWPLLQVTSTRWFYEWLMPLSVGLLQDETSTL